MTAYEDRLKVMSCRFAMTIGDSTFANATTTANFVSRASGLKPLASPREIRRWRRAENSDLCDAVLC